MKKELELVLEELEGVEKPKVSLEQYTIPSDLAAEILTIAYLAGDIKGKVVADLGCGTGKLGIGAAILGGKVIAVDLDKDSLKVAKRNVEKIKKKFKIKVMLVCCDIKDFWAKVDTVVQNPPFGTKRRHADRIFLEKALELGKKIYSLHNNGYKKTREFLTNFIEKRGGKVKKIIKYKFTIPHLFPFHEKPRKSYYVDLYIIEGKNENF